MSDWRSDSTLAQPRPAGYADRQAGQGWLEADRDSALHPTLILIALALFVPQELSIFVAGLRLTAIRIIFIVLFPLFVGAFFRKIASDRYALVASDIFAPCAALWMFVGPAFVYGIADSLLHSGPVALEYFASYLATRVMLQKPGDTTRFAALLSTVITVVVALALADPLTGRYFLRELSAQR